MHHPVLACVLVGTAVALAIACSLGLGIMKDALERLHFTSPVTSFSIGLIVLAVWLDDPSWQARLKATLIGLILFLMNAILSHSTARAIRIRQAGHLAPQPEESIPPITGENPTGSS